MKTANGVQEWATYSADIDAGCTNNCRYCYAKGMAIRFGRATPESWATLKTVRAVGMVRPTAAGLDV